MSADPSTIIALAIERAAFGATEQGMTDEARADVEALLAQLQGAGPDEEQPARFARQDAPVDYAAHHAPAGGIDIGGRHFTGGEFVPSDVVASATPQEKAQLVKKQAPARRPTAPAERKAQAGQRLQEVLAAGGASRDEINRTLWHVSKMSAGEIGALHEKVTGRRVPENVRGKENILSAIAEHLHAQNQKPAAGGGRSDFPPPGSNLEPVRSLGSGTLVRDAQGRQFVHKKGSSPEHLREEAAADAAYAAAGIGVARSRIYEKEGGPAKLSEHVQGQGLKEYLKTATPEQAEAVKAKARAGFVLDCVLANWDAVGTEGRDNMVVTPEGEVVRTNNSGALRHRAEGKLKPSQFWGASVGEIDSLRNPRVNAAAAAVYDGITDDEIRKQAKDLFDHQDQVLAALPADARDVVRRRIASVLSRFVHHNYQGSQAGYGMAGARYAWPSAQTSAALWEPSQEDLSSPVLQPPPDDKPGQSVYDVPESFEEHHRDVLHEMPQDEIDAVREYTGAAYAELNAAMRNCPQTLDCLSPAQRGLADQVEKAIARGGRFAHPVTVYRGVQVKGEVADNFLKLMKFGKDTGAYIRMPGFKSTSLSHGSAFGGITLQIRAKTGLYVESLTSHKGEMELLQGHNLRYKVTEIREVPDALGNKKTFVRLEEV